MSTKTTVSRRRLVLGGASISAAVLATACGAEGAATPPAALQPARLMWWSNLADTTSVSAALDQAQREMQQLLDADLAM
jgi:hypothetical protein